MRTLIFDNGGVEFKTDHQVGYEEIRITSDSARILVRLERDWTKELEKPLRKIDMTVGDLFLDLVEVLRNPYSSSSRIVAQGYRSRVDDFEKF